MSGNKHIGTGEDVELTSDLVSDPGIGQSKGSFATGEHPDIIKGENTVEGDVGEDTNRAGGVPDERRGRANK